jgi:hypothetical protein
MDFYIDLQKTQLQFGSWIIPPPFPHTASAKGIVPNSRRSLGFILEFSLANLPPVTNHGTKMLS